MSKPLSRTWFEPCGECADPEACKDGKECKEGYDCEHTVGFDYTQESEDRYNDPRRR